MIDTKVISYRAAKGYPFDMSTVKNRWVVPVSGYRTAVVEAVATPNYAWSTGVVKVQRAANPNGPFYARASAVTLGPPGAGLKGVISDALTLDDAYLEIEVSTAESITVDLTVTLKDRTQ